MHHLVKGKPGRAAFGRCQVYAPCIGTHQSLVEQQIALKASVNRMAASIGLDHHRVRRVLVYLEAVQWIGDEKDAHLNQLPGAVCSSSYDAASAARRAITP